MMTREERLATVKVMNATVINLGDEEAYAEWIILMPDCADEEDFELFAEDDELYTALVDLFQIIMDYEV